MTDVKLLAIHETEEDIIAGVLKGWGLTSLHCTNGTYAYEAERIVPTTLAGFKFINDKIAVPTDPFLVAVNSDASMRVIMDQKGASQEEKDAVESQHVRALKVALPLNELFPDREIVIVYYDKPTPADLYRTLFQEGINLESLHKWGYGTDPKAAKIEGAEFFNRVLAFPTPNDIKPVCYDITAQEDQSAVVQVIKLTEEKGLDGKPYISTQGKLLFDVPLQLGGHSEKPSHPGGAFPAPTLKQ